MADNREQIGFEQLGIANVLHSYWLQVPLNQREYSWEETHVLRLFHDISEAILNDAPSYFLGNVVTIPRDGTRLEIVDGQQRLATTAILLAAIRDYLTTREEDKLIVEDIETFLTAVDRKERGRVPRLRLNVTDGHFFERRVLRGDPKEAASATSHRRINDAAKLAAAHVQDIVRQHDPKMHGDILNRWITFLEQRAQVVLLKVPSEANAYTMFETLNDRGLRTSQSDLVKNYLFSQSGDRLPEAQQKWAGMRAVLESFEDDEITIDFLRQMLISLYGHMRAEDVYATVTRKAKGSQLALAFLAQLETGAADYAAILNPQHEKWTGYPQSIRRAIATAALVRMRATRPVLLSVARRFTHPEADRAMRLMLRLSVRIMIAGGARSAARSGAVEEALAAAAADISNAKITDARELLTALAPIAPKDAQFQEAFASATVSQINLARYYIRSLEMTVKAEKHPYYLPNDDAQIITLEHVLPRTTEGNWPQFSPEEAEAFYRRLGNLALLNARANSDLKSLPFAEKKLTYAESPYELTRQIATVEDWNSAAIVNRQRQMSEHALKTWPFSAE